MSKVRSQKVNSGRAGFTLVELIIYSALVVIFFTVASRITLDLMITNVKTRANADVANTTRIALVNMTREIKNAKSLVTQESTTEFVWVTNQNSDTVQRFDPVTGNKVGQYSVTGSSSCNQTGATYPCAPTGIAYDPIQHSVWVANVKGDTLVRLDADDTTDDGTDFGAVQAVFNTRISGADNTRAVAFDSAHNAIWVVNRNSQKVLKFDASASSTRASTPIPIACIDVKITGNERDRPLGIVYDPVKQKIWVANEADATQVANINDRLIRINSDVVNSGGCSTPLTPSTNPLDPVLEVNLGSNLNGPRSIAYDDGGDPARGYVWIANNTTGRLIAIDTLSETPAKEVIVADGLFGITHDVFHDTLWTTSNTLSTIYQIRPSDGSILSTYSTGANLRPADAAYGVYYIPSGNLEYAVWTVASNNLSTTNVLEKFISSAPSNPVYSVTTDSRPVALALQVKPPPPADCDFVLDANKRLSFKINGDGAPTTVNTIQVCKKVGAICISADTWVNLTPPTVKVTAFNCNNVSSGSQMGEESVQLSMTVSSANSSTRQEFNSSTTLQTTVSLRQ